MSTTAHTDTTTQVYQVYIKATPEQIWAAITDPDWTQKYGYGGRVEFDLQPGGVYRAHASEEMKEMGAPDVMVDGEVVEADPPRRLVQTWRMAMDPAAAAEGFTRLTYDIAPADGEVTKLTLTHELAEAPLHANMVAGGLEEQGAGGGWSWVLSDLKTVLETGSRMAG